jgi:hypothetical protein
VLCNGYDFSRDASAAKSTWALQAAEKLAPAEIRESFVSGMTSVVPQIAENKGGL